jgi:hypothetical protein
LSFSAIRTPFSPGSLVQQTFHQLAPDHVAFQQLAGILRFHPAVQDLFPVAADDDQHLLRAETVAAGQLQLHAAEQVQTIHLGRDGLVYLAGPRHEPAGAARDDHRRTVRIAGSLQLFDPGVQFGRRGEQRQLRRSAVARHAGSAAVAAFLGLAARGGLLFHRRQFVDVLDQPRGRVGGQVGVVAAIDGHHGTDRAGPQAIDRAVGELAVGRGLTRLDLQLLLQRLHQARGASHVASGPRADADVVFAGWRQLERLVESGQAVQLGQRHLQIGADPLHHLPRHVVILGRDLLQQLDQSSTAGLVLGQ